MFYCRVSHLSPNLTIIIVIFFKVNNYKLFFVIKYINIKFIFTFNYI